MTGLLICGASVLAVGFALWLRPKAFDEPNRVQIYRQLSAIPNEQIRQGKH